jgi:hypothetical protein
MDDMILATILIHSSCVRQQLFNKLPECFLLPGNAGLALSKRVCFSCTEERIGGTLPQAFAL